MVASCPFPANHGTPGAIRELSLYLAKQGHEVHIVTYPQYQEGIDTDGLIIHRAKVPFYKNDEIKIGPSKARVLFDMFLVPKLISVIQKHKIDVIHTHNYEAGIAGAMAKAVTRKPMIYTGINSMVDELPSYEGLKPKWLFEKVGKFLDYSVPRAGNALMVLSDELRDYLVDDMRISDNKVLVIPPGVEPEMFAKGDGEKVRRDLNIATDTPIIMYTGAIEAFQRVDLLLDAMGKVAAEHPNAVLVLAGNVENQQAKNDLIQQADALGFKERLIFIDNVSLDDLPDYLSAADVAVVPRVSCPGYPIKLLNYMAANKAIVSFAGSAKALCHGYNGYVAKNGDVEDLATGISLLIKDKDIAKTIGERARNTLDGHFDWDSIALGTAKLYEQVVDTGKVNAVELSDVLKKSYIPHLVNESGEGFLKQGSIKFLRYE